MEARGLRFIGAMLFAFIAAVILIAIVGFCSPARAHPVDDLTLDLNESGQYPYFHLGLAEPEFFACHKHYWHERRILNQVIRDYAKCIGANESWREAYQLPQDAWYINKHVLNYWDVIPAHPVEDKAGDLQACLGQVEAAEFSVGLFRIYLNWCKEENEYFKTFFKQHGVCVLR